MNNNLRRSIQQILLAFSASTFAVGALAAVGQQNPPPGPGQIPDYFGVTPNYANSPQPILTKVSVTSSTGTGFVAAATTYNYNDDDPTENIMDVQVLIPGTGYEATDVVKVTGGIGSQEVTLTPIIDAQSGGIV